MSFLLQEDDPQATLHDALAFIDACELDDGSSATASTASSSGSSGSSDEEAPPSLSMLIQKTASGKLFLQHQAQVQYHQQPQQPLQPTAKASQAASNRARPVKKHRKSKKYEVQMLREQAAQLEAYLAYYQRVAACGHERKDLHLLNNNAPRSLAVITSSDCTQSWFDIAAQQARESFESEALNLRLRDALVRQEQLTKSLVSVINQTRVEVRTLSGRLSIGLLDVVLTLRLIILYRQGLELLLDRHKQELHFDRLQSVQPAVTVMDDLLVNLQQMYIATDSVLNMQSEAIPGGTTSSLTHVAQDELLAGKCIEVTTSAIAHCDFQQLGRAIWQRMSSQKNELQPAADNFGIFAMQSRVLTSESFQKSYNLLVDLPDQQQSPLALHGTSYLHKFDEAGRYMIMWTSTVALPNDGPQFTEKNWIVLVPGSKSQSALTKTCYQISCAPQGANVLPQTKEQITLVLKTLSRKKREYLEMMQDMFLDKFSGVRHQSQTTTPPSPPVAPAVVAHAMNVN